MADPDYVPGDGNVDVMAETLAVNLYERALHLLGGGDDGEPPTRPMRIINRAPTRSPRSPPAAPSAKRLAQARLDQMKAKDSRPRCQTRWTPRAGQFSRLTCSGSSTEYSRAASRSKTPSRRAVS